MTEVQGLSGWQCARRCLEAMGDVQDFETRLALWRAASRYAQKDRTDRGGLENAVTIRPRANAGGEERRRELVEG